MLAEELTVARDIVFASGSEAIQGENPALWPSANKKDDMIAADGENRGAEAGLHLHFSEPRILFRPVFELTSRSSAATKQGTFLLLCASGRLGNK
jgi:hypothetical protein